MASWVKLCLIVYFMLFGINLILFSAVKLSNESRALVFRAQFVITVEFALLAGGWITWRHLRCLFLLHQPNRGGGDRDLQRAERTVAVTTVWKPWIAKPFILVFLGLTQFSYFSNIFFLQTEPHWFAVASYICLGILLQFLFCLAFLWALHWLGKTARKIYFGADLAHSVNRQEYRMSVVSEINIWQKEKAIKIRNIRTMIALCYSVLIGIYGTYQGSQPPSIKMVEVSIPGLPSSMDNFKIVQISDIHLGPTVGRKKLETVVEIINTFKADAVVLVGDLVDGSVRRLGSAAEVLKDIQAKHGKYYVTGNHEYYTGDVDNWFKFLKGHGFTVLHNEHVKIQHDQDNFFYLAGVDDPTANIISYEGHGMDLPKALGDCAEDKPIILLAHQPKAAKTALDTSYNIKLVLSGHTHGGQMFPLMLGAYLSNPFFAGLYQYKDGFVYVSTGTVFWGIPMRIGTTMEVTQVLLKAA